MKIGITANPNKPAAIEVAKHVATKLADSADLVWAPELRARTGAHGAESSLETMEADALIALGGDGTFLATLQHSQLPLLPINAGTVGFLAEIDGRNAAALDGALRRLLSGQYFVEHRMKIATQIDGRSLLDATNEVVVHTSQVAKMRLFEIGVDGHAVGRIRGDGMILATPTGSTSYALSALGPIIDPGIEAIVVAALAPFRVTQRAVLVDPLRTVSVTLVDPEKDGVVVVDGQAESRLPGGATVLGYRSPRKALFIRFGAWFFGRLKGQRILPWSEEPPESEEGDLADFSPSA